MWACRKRCGYVCYGTFTGALTLVLRRSTFALSFFSRLLPPGSFRFYFASSHPLASVGSVFHHRHHRFHFYAAGGR